MSLPQTPSFKIIQLNLNRKLSSQTRPSQYGDQASVLRKELGRQRATALEGSFGNEKNHYLLDKIRARNQSTEVVWIFLGVMTCNAVQISRRIAQQSKKRKAA